MWRSGAQKFSPYIYVRPAASVGSPGVQPESRPTIKLHLTELMRKIPSKWRGYERLALVAPAFSRNHAPRSSFT
jgi:hypothetical protein